MAYKVTGNIADDARIIVLSETNMSIEHNEEHTTGVFETEDLTNNSKIVLARKADGETFGYSGVTPVEYQSGPVLPTGDDFSTGIDDWTVYRTDGDITADWYNNEYLRISVNSGSSTEYDWMRTTWNYGFYGDFDVEVEYKELTYGGGSGSYEYGLYVVPAESPDGDPDNIRILQMYSQSEMQMRYELNNSVQQTIYNSARPDPTSDNLRLRITKVGAVFTAYHDTGDGSWKLVGQITASPFENRIMCPSFQSYRFGYKHGSVAFSNFKVNSGNVIAPSVNTNFDTDPVGTTYDNIGDPIGEKFEVGGKQPNSTLSITSNGLRGYIPPGTSPGMGVNSTVFLDPTKDIILEFYISGSADWNDNGAYTCASFKTIDDIGYNLGYHHFVNNLRIYERPSSTIRSDVGGNAGWMKAHWKADENRFDLYTNNSKVYTATRSAVNSPFQINLSWGTWTEWPTVDATFHSVKVWGTEMPALPEALPFVDDFSSDLTYWRQTYQNEADITIDTNNNTLQTTIVDSANLESHVYHTSKFKISGDFDISIDVSGSGAMSSNQLYNAYFSVGIPGDNANNRVEIRQQWDSVRRIRVYNVTNGSYPLAYDGTTTTDNCTLRITRTGITFNFYHDENNVASFNRDFGANPLEIVIMNWRYGDTTAILTLDNFTINSGTVSY